MRRRSLFCGALAALSLFAPLVLAQPDRLAGRWEGKVQSPQGERETTAVFKKESEGYSGTVTAMQQNLPLKDIKVDGNKVTAQAQLETPQAAVTIKYDLTLEGETMKGTGEVDFGGQKFSFDIDLKRASTAASAATATTTTQAAGAGGQQGAGRDRAPSPPQPVQKQSIDYFVGSWNVKVVGRESALGVAPREGAFTFAKNANGTLTGRGSTRHEGGTLEETITISFDDATKMFTFLERRSNGVEIRSRGDWTSPLSVRFTIEPIKAGKQMLNLRRIISVISPYSFTIVEELSEDGGPFVRLGNALYSKSDVK